MFKDANRDLTGKPVVNVKLLQHQQEQHQNADIFFSPRGKFDEFPSGWSFDLFLDLKSCRCDCRGDIRYRVSPAAGSHNFSSGRVSEPCFSSQSEDFRMQSRDDSATTEP